MTMETLNKPDIDPNKAESEVQAFPFQIENKSIAQYRSLFEKAEESELRRDILKGKNVEMAFSDFFGKNEKSADFIFMLPCQDQLISTARRYSLDLLEKRLHLSQNDMGALETLVGEILIDTAHSVKQRFRNPEFIVDIKISKFGGYSFEIINQDKIPFKKWLFAKTADEMIEMNKENELNAHAGTLLKKIEVDQLGGRAKYISIDNDKGEKEYTSFYFERKI